MEVQSISQFSVICRVCIKEGTLHPIFNYVDNLRPQEVHDLSIKIRLCANIELALGDGLPSNICKNCINLLIMAHHFKVASEDSDRILRDILNKANQLCDTVLSEVKKESSFESSSSDLFCDTVLPEVKKEDGFESSSSDLPLKDIVSSSMRSKKLRKTKVKEKLISKPKKNKLKALKNDSKDLMKVLEPLKLDITENIQFNSERDTIKLINTNSGDVNGGNFHGNCNLSSSDTEEQKKTQRTNEDLKSDEDFDVNTNFMDNFYGCLDCKRQFPSKIILDQHMAQAHGNVKKEFKCYSCSIMFPTKHKRSAHERNNCPSMPPGTKYQCRECQSIWETRKDFDLHIRRHRTALAAPRANTLELGPLFPCPHCPKTLATHGSLYTHIQNHSKQDLVCETCGKCFKTRIRLMCHIKLHANFKAFSCKECDFRTSTRNSLFLHMRKHSGEKPYSCEVCGKLTATKSNLNSHRKRHTGVKDYKCDICGKSYVDKPPLEEHIMAVHAGLRPHSCPQCEATYTRKTGLRRHIKKRHPKGS